MPTDPPTENPPTLPVPHGQVPTQHIPHSQQPSQHLRFPPANPSLVTQHHQVPGHSVPLLSHSVPPRTPHYAALSSSPNIHGMPPPPPHMSQQTQRPQPQQQPPQRQQRGSMSQQPPQAYMHQFATPGLAYPGQVAQFPMGGNYVYSSHHFYGIAPQPTSQQTGSQPARGQRPQFARNIPSQSQRQPPSRVSVPPPRKHILAIVDPDTNEEVKVDKVGPKGVAKPAPTPQKTAPSTVKIPEKRSCALELVSDPADSSVDSKTENNKPDGTTADDTKPAAPPQGDTRDISENKQTSPVTAPPSETGSSTKTTDVNIPPHVVESTSSRNELSSAAEEKIETVTIKDEVVPTETVQAANLAAESHPSSSCSLENTTATTVPEVNKDDNEAKAMDSVVEGKVSEEATSVSTAGVVSASTSVESPKVSSPPPMQGAGSAEEKSQPRMADEEANGVREGSAEAGQPVRVADQGPPSHESVEEASKLVSPEVKDVPPTANGNTNVESEEQAAARREQFIYKEGERRIYAPDFMFSMRPAANAQKATEFLAVLVAQNLCKGGQSSSTPRVSTQQKFPPMRSMANPLSMDPRGKRSFPPATGNQYMGGMRASGTTAMMGSGGVGSYDAIDLRSARSQNPPPAPRNQPGVMRDLRGTRVGGPRDRFDGPVRQGHGPLPDPFINHAPVEKLKRSENGWKRARESDDEVSSKVKQIRSLLNKLTLEKFDKIFKQIIDIDISSYEILKEVVKEVFEKALFEPKFSGMYADLCGRLDLATREMLQKANIIDEHGKPVYFRNILLHNCREEFTRFAVESNGVVTPAASGNKNPEKEKPTGEKEEGPLTPEQQKLKDAREKGEKDLIATKAKRRMLANVRFISELFLKGLLRENIIHRNCIQKLLAIGIEKKEEDVLEALCKLLSKTGAKLSANREAIQHIDRYFKALQQMSMDHTLPARVRFMLQDLIEQRANNWKLRREEAGAKTIAEIHKDIENEERAKQEAQAANRERRGRGGGGSGMHHRDRVPQNYPPRPAMTMASRQKPSSAGITRSTLALERHASRASPNPPAALQGVRLGPGGARTSTLSAGPNPPSLRPSRGPSNFYTQFMSTPEPREGGVPTQGGDARRAMAKRMPGGPRRSLPIGKREMPDEKDGKMDLPKLHIMVKNVLEEYWSGIKVITETRKQVEEEILPTNYPRFIEEAIKASVDAKMDQREKSVSLLCGIIGDPIPAALFISAFCSVIGLLSDLELDNPRASEFLAMYIGAVAASRKLTVDQRTPTFGLDFVKTAVANMSDHKKRTRLVVQVLSELYKNLTTAIPDEGARQFAVKRALEVLDIDLAGMMYTWNPMKGSLNLQDMLKDYGVLFVLPTLAVELRLKEVLSSNPSGNDVLQVLTGSGLAKDDMRREGFTKMIIRVSFDWLFMDPPESIKTVFTNVVGGPLVKCLGPTVPSNVQMAALMAAQSFVVSNLNILPAHSEGNTDKPGYIAFESLYESDLVEEENFMKWKEDTGWSTTIEGKDKMLMQTTRFFRWLETAEEED